MVWRLWFAVLSLVACLCPLALSAAEPPPTPRPVGTLTVAVATFGNERWLPELGSVLKVEITILDKQSKGIAIDE